MEQHSENFDQKTKVQWGWFVLAILFVILLVLGTYVATNRSQQSKIRVVYSLDQKQNDQEIVSVIDNADTYVYFAIYYFTLHDIADALIRAQKRGVVVWGIMDREASAGSNKVILEDLRNAGVAVETQKHQNGIMHIKAVVTEKEYASGSYNWTGSATNANDEVLEIGSDKSVHDQYLNILKKIILVNQ